MTPPTMGEPGWADLGSSDVDASHTFYTTLFGWAVDVVPDGGGYGIFHLDGKQVAGGGPRTSDEGPAAWTVYALIDDAAASSARVAEAGGTVIAPTLEAMTAGTMVIVHDPQGAVFAVLQNARTAGS